MGVHDMVLTFFMVFSLWFLGDTLICNDCVGQDEKSCVSTMIQKNCSNENATACTIISGIQKQAIGGVKHVRDISSSDVREYRKSCTYLRGIDCERYCEMLEALQFEECKMVKCCFEDFCN